MSFSPKILITGANGQLGTELALAQAERYGHDRVVTSDKLLDGRHRSGTVVPDRRSSRHYIDLPPGRCAVGHRRGRARLGVAPEHARFSERAGDRPPAQAGQGILSLLHRGLWSHDARGLDAASHGDGA